MTQEAVSVHGYGFFSEYESSCAVRKINLRTAHVSSMCGKSEFAESKKTHGIKFFCIRTGKK